MAAGSSRGCRGNIGALIIRIGFGVYYTIIIVDDINPALPQTLNYGNYGIFLIMGHAGFLP